MKWKSRVCSLSLSLLISLLSDFYFFLQFEGDENFRVPDFSVQFKLEHFFLMLEHLSRNSLCFFLLQKISKIPFLTFARVGDE